MSTEQPQDRNYNTISPSAKSLLLLKGLTGIPFARAAAALISLPGKYEPDFSKKDAYLWGRVLHFESRYRSIDQLLADLPAKNILELSSGFSFRGLAAVQNMELNYIDTDLPGIISTKKEMVASLQNKETIPKGTLELLPLNALDEQQFAEITSRFPPGELVIVNEGLLMYLGMEEKKKLCKIIRGTLLQRGGYWITADIYIKTNQDLPSLGEDDELQQFLEEHRVRDNMFESMEEAASFFKSEGLIIDKEAAPEYTSSGSLKYLLQSVTEEQISNFSKMEKIQATWRLKVDD